MTIKKDEALSKIMDEFESMANKVLEQLDLLEHIFASGEIPVIQSRMEQMDENEKCIDRLEMKIDDRIIQSIVLYQPVASDIRKLFACFRIITNLERIGDYSINLIHFLNRIKQQEIYDQLLDMIYTMFVSSSQMVKKSILSFVKEDRELAIWTIQNDVVVDEMNRKMLKKVISTRKTIEEGKNSLISFITIKEMVDNIERIADHAVNIGEATIYFLEGRDIRHNEP
ncbi:MAG TPA: PhoU domain-containing protein [Prolixibacteraceae bacterium]|nr:PhoU domain-containing protein [Prolixibacteraceae bacterium]